MTDSEKIDLLLEEMGEMKSEIHKTNERISTIMSDVSMIEYEMHETMQLIVRGQQETNKNIFDMSKEYGKLIKLEVKLGVLETRVRELEWRVSA